MQCTTCGDPVCVEKAQKIARRPVPCAECAKPVVAKGPGGGRRYKLRFCSRACLDRHHHRQRRGALATLPGPSDHITLSALYDRDGGLCGICGEHVPRDARKPDPNSPSVDHKLALKRGGLHRWDNVQLAHLGCNCRKGVKATAAATQRAAARRSPEIETAG